VVCIRLGLSQPNTVGDGRERPLEYPPCQRSKRPTVPNRTYQASDFIHASHTVEKISPLQISTSVTAADSVLRFRPSRRRCTFLVAPAGCPEAGVEDRPGDDAARQLTVAAAMPVHRCHGLTSHPSTICSARCISATLHLVTPHVTRPRHIFVDCAMAKACLCDCGTAHPAATLKHGGISLLGL
jgi:hypothetical protein